MNSTKTPTCAAGLVLSEGELRRPTVLALALSVCMGAFSAWGVLAPNPTGASNLFLAALYVLAQFLANAAAMNFQRAAAYQAHLTAAYFCVAFLVLAALEAAGIHAAWSLARLQVAGVPDWAGWVLGAFAFLEPGFFWGGEVLRHKADAARRDQEQADLNAGAERERIRAAADALRRGAVAAVAAAGLNAAAATTGVASDRGAEMATQDAERAAHRAHGWTGPRRVDAWRQFQEAHGLGLTPQQIIRELRLPRSTIYRWTRILRDGAPVRL